MAEAIGEVTPRGVQHLLNDAHWDPDAVRDDVLGQVVAHLGDEASGVLVVDETGFLKWGEKSVGVALQYSGKEDVSILGCSSHTIHPQFIAVCSHKWSSERPETERSAET